MGNIGQDVAEWAKRLGLGNLQDELFQAVAALPPTTAETILDSVRIEPDGGGIGFCADSILHCSAPAYHGGSTAHLQHETPALLSLVPFLTEPYFAFSGARADNFLFVMDTFRRSLQLVRETHDVPSMFILNPEDEYHLIPALRGALMVTLIGDEQQQYDIDWLGDHYGQLARFCGTLIERDDVSRSFCEALLSTENTVLAPGAL